MLYESFVSKTGTKCNCLVDFFATSLLITRVSMHAHCCSLMQNSTLRLIATCRKDFEVERSIVRWVFLCSVPPLFYNLQKFHFKGYSMAFNINYSTKSSNIALLLKRNKCLQG